MSKQNLDHELVDFTILPLLTIHVGMRLVVHLLLSLVVIALATSPTLLFWLSSWLPFYLLLWDVLPFQNQKTNRDDTYNDCDGALPHSVEGTHHRGPPVLFFSETACPFLSSIEHY